MDPVREKEIREIVAEHVVDCEDAMDFSFPIGVKAARRMDKIANILDIKPDNKLNFHEVDVDGRQKKG